MVIPLCAQRYGYLVGMVRWWPHVHREVIVSCAERSGKLVCIGK